MTLSNLKKCLDIIFSPAPKDIEQLNRIYMATAKKPLDVIGEEGVVGFKMRFTPPNPYPLHVDGLRAWNRFLERLFQRRYFESFKKMMFDSLRKHNVVVLMAIRQDVLRLGLSKYHGDGTGKPGHLQFKVARGAIAKHDIGKIQVDCNRLEEIVSHCETLHEDDRLLMEELKHAGIQVYPVLYEDFVTDKQSYLERLFGLLELDVTSNEISRVLGEEEYFTKVHPDDISQFVKNHEEVSTRFADRYVSWR
jgi:hypothetical protein